MQILRLSPADAKSFQALRLFALQEKSSAFGSSHEEELALPMATIAARLMEKSDRGIWGAFEGDELVGLLGLARENMRKLSHKASLWGMYVAPAARGRGVARALLLELLAFIRTVPAVMQVNLSVNAANLVAIALYESEGFIVFGQEACALMIEGEPHDELHMCLRLSAAISA